MTDYLLILIEKWGTGGILLSLFIEGSAFPFIGTIFLVTVGLISKLTWLEITVISVIGSFLYAVGSYIPYSIGFKLGNTLENRLSMMQKKKLVRVKNLMNTQGVWSIAILSPLHLGNVIPFLAGMSNMKLPYYTLLTMLGIAPSTFLLLSIGHFYNGSIEIIKNMIKQYQTVLLFGLTVIAIVFFGLKIIKHRRHKNKEEIMR